MPHRAARVLCIALLGTGVNESAASANSPAVATTVVTTLNTAPGQIRQFAFDGNLDTYFCSAQNPRATDHFTLLFDEPLAISEIRVMSGRPDGRDKLNAGTLQTSLDAVTFADRMHFTAGEANASIRREKTRAVRIRTSDSLNCPLVIREVIIRSEPAAAIFKYPVEFIVESTAAPALGDWACRAARECERSYAMINEELKSDGYIPPSTVTIVLKKSLRDAAAKVENRSRIQVSAADVSDHPDDIGIMIHETAHVVQDYHGPRNPAWLVEGVADYVQYFKYEPGKHVPINDQHAHYNGSYRVTATFLAYLVQKYDKALVQKLNALMRDGKYSDDAFQKLTGKTAQQLDDEWRATLHK